MRGMLYVAVALLVTVRPIQTQPADVPLEIQLPLLLKALAYERTLETRVGDSVQIGVIFDPGDAQSREVKDRVLGIAKGLTRLTLKKRPIVLTEIPYIAGRPAESLEAQRFDILYVAPMDDAAVREMARLGGVTQRVTLAASAADVERGLVLGIETEGGRPQVLVNVTAAETHGASFDPNFLKICRLID